MPAEVRMARIVEAIARYKAGAVSCVEAAELLGVSERHFRRLRDRYEEDGAEGIIDRRGGPVSIHKAPRDRVDRLIETYVARYFDVTVKHFNKEITKRGHQYGYTWTKAVLKRAGLVKKGSASDGR